MSIGPVPNAAFDDREYARGCPSCGWTVPPCQPWDEGLRRPEFCANCGLALTRLACAECGAPAATDQVPSPKGWVTVFGVRCVHCGGKVVPSEPKMRDRPPDDGPPRPVIKRI